MTIFNRRTKPGPTTDALINRWEEGYEKGRSDQKGEDNAVLERATTDAYVDGYDKGFDKGEAAAISTLEALEAGK